MKLKWVTCPDCGRKLLRIDGQHIFIKCRGSYMKPNCRAMLKVNIKTGDTEAALPVSQCKEGLNGK